MILIGLLLRHFHSIGSYGSLSKLVYIVISNAKTILSYCHNQDTMFSKVSDDQKNFSICSPYILEVQSGTTLKIQNLLEVPDSHISALGPL